VLSAHTSSGPLPGGDALERKAVGKIAAGVWAAIAFFGALATVKPLRFPEMDLSTTRVVVLSATVIAVVTLVVPWARAPKAFVNLLLVLMAGYITALAHSSGAVASNATGCANRGLDVAADLAGTMHYGGRGNRDAAGTFYVAGRSGEGYSWNGAFDVGAAHSFLGYPWGDEVALWGDAQPWADATYTWDGYPWPDEPYAFTLGEPLTINRWVPQE